MRKLILNLILTITMLTSAVYASDNSLNAVILEGTATGYNLTLRSDSVANVKKIVEDSDNVVLDIKNISTSVNLDTRYLNAKNINNMVVENVGNNEVKIYLQGKNVDKTDIIFDTPASAPVVVGEGVSNKELGWAGAVVLLALLFAGSFRKSVEKDTKQLMQNDLAEREIKLYKELKSDILTSARVENKIREQLALRKELNTRRRSETIRSLQKMSLR